MEFSVTTSCPEETIELGWRIGGQLKGGEVFALTGPLGSGKTYFVKGIAYGAGAPDSSRVNSPTFVIVNEYSGRLDIYHVDAYRLASAEQFEMIGFDDYCYPGSVVLVEWADRIESSIRGIDCIGVQFEHKENNTRRISMRSLPDYIRV